MTMLHAEEYSENYKYVYKRANKKQATKTLIQDGRTHNCRCMQRRAQIRTKFACTIGDGSVATG